MLISESKLRRIIRQELIKENKRLNENRLLNTSLALLIAVSSALSVNAADAKDSMPQSGTKDELAQCLKHLKSSPAGKTESGKDMINHVNNVLKMKTGNDAVYANTTATCKLVIDAGEIPDIKSVLGLPKQK